MNTYTVAELTRQVSAVLSQQEPVLITSKGKPQNIIINVSGVPVDKIVDLAREIEVEKQEKADGV